MKQADNCVHNLTVQTLSMHVYFQFTNVKIGEAKKHFKNGDAEGDTKGSEYLKCHYDFTKHTL